MIKLENISKYYYSANAVVPALRKIKLEFQVGEFIAITGESGSGKSTLLNIISGLDIYDDGELYIDGQVTSDYDSTDWERYRKNKIGFVFQNHNLIEHYNVLSNVESALLIQGHSVKEAKKVAKELIAKVGLSKQLHQKAAKLSTGQKQRLSIARALAKNTDIIIADEPTGNLDSENGKQIMQLLSELSKDKLIITVTHNYDEAAPYVTRKIRLHEGEVVSDFLVNKENEESEKRENTSLKTQEDKGIDETLNKNKDIVIVRKNKKSARKIAWRFTCMNLSTQPGRVILFILFLLITAGVSFIFLGDIYSNWDDTDTKVYKTEMFYNPDDTRIVVKKPDGSDINQEDLDIFKEIKYVQMADKHDYSNDINYYFTEDIDYEILYRPNDNPQNAKRLKEVELSNNRNFVKSSTCITSEALSAGNLPQELNEIVAYSDDSTIIGTEQTCFFDSRNAWGFDNYYTTTVKIVGIQNKFSNQLFFSEELCEMLAVTMYEENYSLSICKNIYTNAYMNNIKAYPVIGKDLNYGEIRVSADLVAANSQGLIGDAELTIYKQGEKFIYDDLEVLPLFNLSTNHFIEVNEEWFYELFHHNSKQASLYMDDYIHTDYVLNKLYKLGYDAISPIRIGSYEYNGYLQAEHNKEIFIALLVLLIISFLEILMVSSTMKIRNKDLTILASMGMENSTIKLMNYYELYLYGAVSIFLVIATANLAKLFGTTHYLSNTLKYYNFITYSIYVALNFTVISITVWSFNRYLKRKQKWS